RSPRGAGGRFALCRPRRLQHVLRRGRVLTVSCHWHTPNSCGPSVNADVLAGDPAGVTAGDERDDIGDLLDTTQPAEYRHALKSGEEFRVLPGPVGFCLGSSGRHGVDSDPTRPQLTREDAGQLLDRAFGHVIDA